MKFVETPIYDAMVKEFPEAIEVLNRVEKENVNDESVGVQEPDQMGAN